MTAAAMPRPTGWRAPAEMVALRNWLLCWIVLPNVGFWLLWIVAAPPRHAEIIATGVIGLIARRRSFAVRVTLFAATLIYSLLSFISALFNLAISSLLASLRFASELNVGASIEYAVCGIGIAATASVAIHTLRRPGAFSSTGALLTAVAAIAAAAAADRAMSQEMGGAYKRIAPTGALFGSAVGDSGFATLAGGRQDLVLVMVESMGLPTDPAVRARLMRRLKAPDIRARYDLTEGASPYFGSTTSGEIRELCGRWGDYYDLLDRRDPSCLPAILARRGYATTALHGFEGEFFARNQWYPHIGFQRMAFREELMREGAAFCPGVFPAACGRDVPLLIANRLHAARKPQFLYWLTVNSHLPVPADAALRTDRCPPQEMAQVRAFPMICRQFSIWDDVADAVAAHLLRPGAPPTDVLLVGDHMPPYFDRAQRAQFDPERVPWILLKARPPRALETGLAAR